MPAGTSLGHGIGLQTPRGLDDKWIQRLAGENRQDELAARKREDDLIKETDIDVDLSKYLPPYAKAIGAEYSKFLNNVVRYKQANNGKITPAVAKEMAFRARQEMNKYEQANANAKRYVEGQGFLKDEELVRDLTSADKTVYDLSKYNRGQFIQVGNSGEFAFLAVPDKDIPVKYDDKADRTGKPTGKIDRIGNREWQEVSFEAQPEAIQREAIALYGNSAFQQQELFRAGQQAMKQQGESDEAYQARIKDYLMQKATEKAEANKPLSYSAWEDGAPYRPPSGSGSDKKMNNIPMATDVKATIKGYKKDAQGKYDKNQPYDSEQVFPFSKPVKVSQPITIPANTDMFSAADNLPIEGSFNVVFKPSNIVPVKLKKDGKYKSYVLGTIDKNVNDPSLSDAERKEMEKLVNIYVPLEMVEGQISNENDIADYNTSFTELVGGGGKAAQDEWNKKWSALKSGETLVGLDGKTYKKK